MERCQDLQQLMLLEYLWQVAALIARYNTWSLLQEEW